MSQDALAAWAQLLPPGCALASTWPGRTLVVLHRSSGRMVTIDVYRRAPGRYERWLLVGVRW